MSGGDPTRMTLRAFIDVAFAIFVAEYQRLGMDLITAVEKVSSLGSSDEPAAPAVDNAASINELMSMMGGVKGSPV